MEKQPTICPTRYAYGYKPEQCIHTRQTTFPIPDRLETAIHKKLDTTTADMDDLEDIARDSYSNQEKSYARRKNRKL